MSDNFKSSYLRKFEDSYKGYIPDDSFYQIIEQGLDNIKIPDQVSRNFSIEKMTDKEIYKAIADGSLALMHLDKDYGYDSTINYLSKLLGKEKLILTLFNQAMHDKTSQPAHNVLTFLSRSNLAPEYKELRVATINNTPVKLNDIVLLSQKEVKTLCTEDLSNTQKTKEFIQKSSWKDCANLFFLTLKFTEKADKQKLFEMKDKDGNTPLHMFATNHNVEVVKAILETDGIDKQSLLEAKNKDGMMPLHLAARFDKGDMVEAMITALNDSPELSSIITTNFMPSSSMLKNIALAFMANAELDLEGVHQLQQEINFESSSTNEEKCILDLLKPEDLTRLFNIKFSDDLGAVGSEVRKNKETQVLEAVYGHLTRYGASQSWDSPTAWAGSAARIYNKVDALLRSQDLDGNANEILVQKEVDKILNQIVHPHPQPRQTLQLKPSPNKEI